jgi:hypothetical protein
MARLLLDEQISIFLAEQEYLNTVRELVRQSNTASDQPARVIGITNVHAYINAHFPAVFEQAIKDPIATYRNRWLQVAATNWKKSEVLLKEIYNINCRTDGVCVSDQIKCIEELTKTRVLTEGLINKYRSEFEQLVTLDFTPIDKAWPDTRDQLVQYLQAN